MKDELMTPAESVIDEAEDMIRLVMQKAKGNLEKAVASGALNITEDSSEHILQGKIVAKAVLLDAIDEWLTLGNKEKEVKNLRKMI